MTKLGRVALATDIVNNVFNNTGRLIKGKTVQDRLINLLDSSLNFDDENVNGGYLGIDFTTGLVDISFIKAGTPTGQFLRDDGSWQTVSTATPGLAAVLAAGGNTGELSITSDNGFSAAEIKNGYVFIVSGTSSRGQVYLQEGQADLYVTYLGGVYVTDAATLDPRKLLISTSQNVLKHDVKNYFDAPVNSFTGHVEIASGKYIKGGTGWIDFYTDNGIALTSDSGAYGTPYAWVSSDNFGVSRPAAGFYEDSAYQKLIQIVQGDLSDVVDILGFRGLRVLNDKSIFSHPDEIEYRSALHLITGEVSVTSPNTLGLLSVRDNYIELSIDNAGLYADSTSLNVTHGFGINLSAPLVTFLGNSFYHTGYGIDVVATGGSDVLNIGASNADVINIGGSGTQVNIIGTVTEYKATQSYVTDQLITINRNGPLGSGGGSGFEIEENAVITAYFKLNSGRTGYSFKSPDTSYYADLIFTNFTANRVLNIPDENGTLATQAYATAKVADSITDGVTTIAPSQNAVYDALVLKLPIAAGTTTGVALTFETDRVYGSIGTPETGNITYSATNAQVGVTNLIIHNNGTAPTFGANMKILSGSGAYVISVVNYIYVTYINSTEVIYSINQRT